jgi:glycosyltransferase involved in cell wall biosynthesis
MRVLVMTAIYPTPENPAFGSFVRTQAESLRRAGIGVEVLVLKGRNRKLIYPKGVLQLRNLLNGGSFDLVHAHYGYVGMVARTQWKVPVVVTYHGDDLLGTVMENGKKARWSALVVAAGKKLAQHVDAAIVQTPEMASKLTKSNVFVIPHEVDFEVFHPTERMQARAMLGLKAHKKYLLFAANPQIAVKRFPLAKAVADWLARRDPSIQLLVVSKEPQERLALYMSACDALVFPSYQEGSPNVVKQAMACNLPIVATDVGDVRLVIGKTKGCHVCNPTVSEFAARITEILSPPRRTDGRERIRHLDSSTVSERIIEVYERVLRNREKRFAGQKRADVVATANKLT